MLYTDEKIEKENKCKTLKMKDVTGKNWYCIEAS